MTQEIIPAPLQCRYQQQGYMKTFQLKILYQTTMKLGPLALEDL